MVFLPLYTFALKTAQNSAFLATPMEMLKGMPYLRVEIVLPELIRLLCTQSSCKCSTKRPLPIGNIRDP